MQLDEAYSFLTEVRPCGPKRDAVRVSSGGQGGWVGRRAGTAEEQCAGIGWKHFPLPHPPLPDLLPTLLCASPPSLRARAPPTTC